MSHSPPPDQEDVGANRVPSRATVRASLACSILGAAGWLGLLPFLDLCRQSEQLARYFAAFVDFLVLGAGGGPATLLLLFGLWLVRRAPATIPAVDYCRRIAKYGLAVGVAVTLVYGCRAAYIML